MAARRPLSDQRHLLVELELDDSVLLRAHQLPQRDDDHGRRHAPPHKTPSPYKFKQKVLSSRRVVDPSEDDPVLPPRASSQRRPSARRHAPAVATSPLVVIADAVRDNGSQRSRVLLELQDELRLLGPSGQLSTAVVKLLNRLRSLTLSVVEMVRYLREQLAAEETSSSDATTWALELECQETLARLSASDVDALLAFPSLARTFERWGVSALRNPLLDGVALDSSELLLWSCQTLSTRSQASSSSSLFQLVVARLEAFAVQARRQYPAWQVLPHDRVARALLDLVESENKANATRMLPSYLRPGAGTGTSRYVSVPVSVDGTTSEEDDEGPSVALPVAPVKAQAWTEDGGPAKHHHDAPPRRVSLAQALADPRESPRALPPAPDAKPSPRPTVASLAPGVAEPKTHGLEKNQHHTKKTKKLHERSATLSSLGVTRPPSAVPRAETKDPFQLASQRHDEDVKRTRETIASALDKLPQFSLESLGITTPGNAVATEPLEAPAQTNEELPAPIAENTEAVVASESGTCGQLTEAGETLSSRMSSLSSAPPLPPPPSLSPLPSVRSLSSPRVAHNDDGAHDPNTTSELSRILALCRDVHVTAMDLDERLHPLRVETPTSPSTRGPALSTRFLERELKMLRRYFRLWALARAERHARLVALRCACAARRIGRFGRVIVRRAREAACQRERARRHHAATRIQRSWRAWLARQRTRASQLEFRLLSRCFRRYRFFTCVERRRRRRGTACQRIQRWWRRTLRKRREAEREREAQQRDQERRAEATRRLQAFVRERALKRRLAEAEEATRRLHMMQNMKALKARQDETKRRQLEAKRLVELRVAMQTALHDMEAKWHDAEAETQRRVVEHAQHTEIAQREAQAREKRLARAQIDRFLERTVLRRRLRAAVDASAALAEAKRALEVVRTNLERQHRDDHARHLLQGRMAEWKARRVQSQLQQDASDTLWRMERQRQRERDEWAQRLHAQLRARMAHSLVVTASGAAASSVAQAAFATRLAAKHDETQRLRRQAARERIAGFVERRWMWHRLATAQNETQRLRDEQAQAVARERHAEAQRHRQCVRDQSERVVAMWLTQQVVRVRASKAIERARLEASLATQHEAQRRVAAEAEASRLRVEKDQLLQQQRRREQLVATQTRKAQLKAAQLADKHDRAAAEASHAASHVERQHAELLAQLQRHQRERVEREAQLLLERQARAVLVDVVVDTQRLAQAAATQALVVALEGVTARCQSLTLAATYRHIMARAWQREACVRWRRFTQRRQDLAALATHMLWPQASGPSPEQRDARLAELKRVAAVRRVQRGWHASRKRLRQARRLEVKRAEDALVARAKRRGSSIGDQQLMAEASAAKTLTHWARREARARQLRFQAATVSLTVVLWFGGGRAWATTTTTTATTPTTTSKPTATTTTRLRFDRVVTRRLLRALDSAVSLGSDIDRVLHELVGDLAPIVATAKTSPRAVALPDGTLELGDVDEAELPRFLLATRQLSKTRSMAKRQQLLDAKARGGPTGLTIFDAVECASAEDAQFLLLQGEDLHATEPRRQRTALHMLAFSGEPVAQRVALLRFLVQRAKLDLHARDDSGATPLVAFAAHGCVALVDALLQLAPRPLDLCREIDRDGRNAFHSACIHDQPECAAVIHQSVVAHNDPAVALRELHCADKRGATPLHTLARLGHCECLRVVLTALDESTRKRGLDQRDRDGRTPLHLAVAHGHVETAHQLVASGASVSAGDAWQRRALHYAVRGAASTALALILLLVDHAAELDAADARGDTALHWAAASGRTPVVRQLLLLGADPHVLNGDWESPAAVAAIHRHGDCARLLLPASNGGGGLHGPMSAASAQSYYLPSAAVPVGATRHGAEIDWDELQQGVELVEESGHFSSEDEHGDHEEEEEE